MTGRVEIEAGDPGSRPWLDTYLPAAAAYALCAVKVWIALGLFFGA